MKKTEVEKFIRESRAIEDAIQEYIGIFPEEEAEVRSAVPLIPREEAVSFIQRAIAKKRRIRIRYVEGEKDGGTAEIQ